MQTTSGAVYLDKYDGFAPAAAYDKDVAAAASVEPLLRFPARIGIARIEGGLTPIPEAEAEAWHELGRRLGPNWGEFVPVSPLIARLAMTSAAEGRQSGGYAQLLDDVIRGLRMGAARQHLDAVLVYEVHARTDTKATPLALADLMIVGAYLVPSRAIEAKAFASALLVDVRNGYPYFVTDTIAKEDWKLRSAVGSDASQQPLAIDVKTEAVRELVPRVEKLAYDLRIRLAETREKR